MKIQSFLLIDCTKIRIIKRFVIKMHGHPLMTTSAFGVFNYKFSIAHSVLCMEPFKWDASRQYINQTLDCCYRTIKTLIFEIL